MSRSEVLLALALALAVAVPAPGVDAAPARADEGPGSVPAATAPPPRGHEPLARRARALARDGDAGRAVLLAEAARGRGGARRAALQALAAGATADGLPAATTAELLPAALDALAAPDPLLREAAVTALEACGAPAVAALRALAAASGPAPVPAARAHDALHEILRGHVERDFLALWGADDGSFHGMFADLRVHGDFGARVLTAIALDRRMAGAEDLGFGPYVWRRPPDGTRERSEIRHRALDALGDAGNAEAREALRKCLRTRPAERRFGNDDADPVPAAFDDMMRIAIACLGDPVPLEQVVESFERRRGRLGPFWESLESGRAASALIALGRVARDPAVRHVRFTQALALMESSLETQARRLGQGADATDHYNLACVLAQRDAPGDRARAIEHLARSVDISPVASRWMRRDGDLENLREMPAFLDLVREVEAREADARRR